MHPSRILLMVTAALALFAGTPSVAHALPHARHAVVRSIGRVVGGPGGFRRGQGPRWGQWDNPYGGTTSFVGGRGDDRWRWYDGARAPGFSGGLHRYDGPPYDREQW